MRAHFFTPFLFVVLLSSLALAEEPPPATPTNTAQPPGVDGAAGAPLAQAAPGAMVEAWRHA